MVAWFGVHEGRGNSYEKEWTDSRYYFEDKSTGLAEVRYQRHTLNFSYTQILWFREHTHVSVSMLMLFLNILPAPQALTLLTWYTPTHPLFRIEPQHRLFHKAFPDT